KGDYRDPDPVPGGEGRASDAGQEPRRPGREHRSRPVPLLRQRELGRRTEVPAQGVGSRAQGSRGEGAGRSPEARGPGGDRRRLVGPRRPGKESDPQGPDAGPRATVLPGRAPRSDVAEPPEDRETARGPRGADSRRRIISRGNDRSDSPDRYAESHLRNLDDLRRQARLRHDPGGPDRNPL